MALAYNLWTEEQCEKRNVVDDGDYPFEIMAITSKKTKGGMDKDGQPKPIRDMLEIEFNFWDVNGVVRKQKDWIVFMEGMDWKLRHLSDSTDTLDLYEEQKLDCSDLKNKKGVFKLGTKDMVGEDGQKRKVNFVKDYVKKSLMKSKQDDSFIDDDIPL